MFAADVGASFSSRENDAGPIPDRLYAKDTSGEPEIVPHSPKKVNDLENFQPHDNLGDHIRSTTYQKSFDVVDNLELNREVDKRISDFRFGKRFEDGVLSKSKEIKDSVDKAVRSYTREGKAWRLTDMERPAVTFDTVAMESDVKKGVIDDLDKFVVSKEEAVGHNRVRGNGWKRAYLLYDTPGGTGSESSLIAAMANYLSYDIYDLNVTSFSSILKMRKLLDATTNRSIIAIKDFDCIMDMQDGPSNPYKWIFRQFLVFCKCQWSSRENDRIIVFTTNHKDRLDTALMRFFKKDIYIHMSSPAPQPRGLTEGGENLQLDPTDQKSLVDFDATNNRAHQYSEKISTGETLKREFIDNSIPSLEDTQQYSGGRPDHDAPKSLGVFKGRKATKRSYFVVTNSKEIKDNVDKAVKIYTKEGMAWRSIDMERPVATFDTVAMESEVGIIDDLDKFVVSKEGAAGHRRVRGKSWKRGYLLNEPPGGSGSESSLIAAMAAYLSFDIYDLNVTSFSSLLELRTLLASTTNRSIIAVKDFDCLVDMQAGPPDSYEITLLRFLLYLDFVWSSTDNERIIVFTINHKDRLNSALLRPLDDNIYVHTSSPSPQPRGLPEGGENLQLDSTDQQSLVDFDAINNIAHLLRTDWSVPILCYSEKISTGEALKREFIDNSVLSLEDTQQYSGGRPDDAPKSLGDTSGQGLHTPDSLEWMSFKVVETLPLQEQPNDIIHLKREFITKGVLSLEDHQQHLGSRCEDNVKTLVVSISNMKGILVQHEIHQQPFQQNWAAMKERPKGVLSLSMDEKLDPRLQSSYISKLARSSPRHLALPYGGEIVGPISLSACEVAATNIETYLVSQDQSVSTASHFEKKITRVTLKREGITSCVYGLEDGQQHFGSRHKDSAKSLIVGIPTLERICREHGIDNWLYPVKNKVRQSLVDFDATNNRARLARADQSSPTVSNSETENTRGALKRERLYESELSLEDLQHFGGRSKDAAEGLGVKRICRKHGINEVSTVKRIRRQYGVHSHRWPFQRKWTSMKGYSLGEERPVEVISLSMHEKLVSRLQCIYRTWLARSSHRPLVIRSGGKIVGHIAFSSSEFASTNNRPHLVRYRSGSNAPHPEKGKTRETTSKEGTASSLFSKEDLEQHFGMTRKDVAEKLGVSVSTLKRICRDHGIQRWQNRRRNNVWRSSDPHGERNTSSTCETLAINGQAHTKNGIGDQNLEPIDFPPDSFEVPNLLNTENGSMAGFVNRPTFHYDGPVYPADMDLLVCQPNDPSTPFTACANPSAHVVQLPQIASTQMLSENMGSSEGFRSVIASQEQHVWPEHVSGYNSTTLPTFSGPVPDQQMSSAPYVMPTNPQMPSLMERQDMGYVTVKATYGVSKIRFEFPLASGIIELKKEVAMRLEIDSFESLDIEYEDEERDWIRIACDKDLSDYLRSSLANPIARLRVLDKVANGADFCKSCSRSLKRKRP